MWIQMFRRLFGKRTKIHHLPKEKVKENGRNEKLGEFADKEQEHLQEEMKTSYKRLEDSHEILLSLHVIFKKHAECSENLLREIEKLSDVIEKTKMPKMEVSQAFTPVPGSFSPSSSSFSSAGIRLPPIKELQHSSVDSSLHTDEAKPSQFPKLAWDANESISNNTEEIFLTGTEINEMELQTVEETNESVQNEPPDVKIRCLEMEFHAKKDKWSKFEKEEKLKLKLETSEAKQRRQTETKELKLKIKFLEKKAKREMQERIKKLKDLEKEIKNEKAMLLLRQKELKKKVKMESKEECDEEKMEEHRKDDEKVDEVQNKNVLKIFQNLRFRSCKAV
ncbi:DNA ligase 1-like [Trichomycterus rosablanca]|uniref:DNA ligase 1-like n=1 Tax=Trichomycterus rosablanca TaxID=2290929 RepID=UPI002F356EF0